MLGKLCIYSKKLGFLLLGLSMKPTYLNLSKRKSHSLALSKVRGMKIPVISNGLKLLPILKTPQTLIQYQYSIPQ